MRKREERDGEEQSIETIENRMKVRENVGEDNKIGRLIYVEKVEEIY